MKEKKAINYLRKSLDIHTASTNCSAMADSTLERDKEELQSSEKMLRLLTAKGKPKEIANCNGRSGKVCVRLNRYGKAFDYFKKALKIYNEIDDKIGIVEICIDLGNLHVNLCEYTEAIDRFRKSLEIANEVPFQLGIARANYCLGDVYQKLEDCKKATDHFKVSLRISTAIGEDSLIALNMERLAKI